jgi:hypothetical protein
VRALGVSLVDREAVSITSAIESTCRTGIRTVHKLFTTLDLPGTEAHKHNIIQYMSYKIR